jgi:hypothetical protein
LRHEQETKVLLNAKQCNDDFRTDDDVESERVNGDGLRDLIERVRHAALDQLLRVADAVPHAHRVVHA